MAFMLLGLLLLGLKLTGLNPVADWSWFAVLVPFALALVWWVWSDQSGRTKRLGMRKDQAHKDDRRRNLAKGMGLEGLLDRSVAAKLRRADERDKAARQRRIDKIEGERERQRRANRESILTTRMDSRYDTPSGAAGAQADRPGSAGL